MNSLADNGASFPILVAYGFLIVVYLIILRLLLNLLQQMGDKHRTQRSVIDLDIRRTMTPQVDTSMHTYDFYGVAVIIAKGGITAIAMAAVITLLVIKIGALATAMLIVIVISGLWAVNRWVKSQESARSIRNKVRRYVQMAGNVGTIVILSIALVVLLFVMIVIQ